MLWCINNAAKVIIHYYSGTPACSWYTLAHKIFQQAIELELIQHSPVLTPINSSDYPTQAKRPAYSVLDNTKIQQQFNIRQSDWKNELNKMLKHSEMSSNNVSGKICTSTN